jgi:hypothetical protein
MLSRALSLATVMLLIGCFVMASPQAQAQNLEAGKSPSQIFAGSCTACHKSPRGLLKTVPAGSLPGFLREHYTTSSNMASLLSAFLISNGATDTRYLGNQPKQDKDAKPEAKPAAAGGPPEQLDRWGRRLRPAPPQEAVKPEPEPQQAAKPDADGVSPQADPGHRGRNAKRLARPVEAPDAAKPLADQAPGQAASERGPDGRRLSAKQRLSKRGKPGIEEPAKPDATKPDTANGEAAKTDSAKTDAAKEEPLKSEPAKEDKPASATAKDDSGKPEGAKSSGEGKPEAAKADTSKSGSGETPVLRADPVPSVTPAPAARPAEPTAVSGGTPEPPPSPSTPAAQSAPPAPAAPPSPAVTASTPPPAPTAPAGPPVPPISQ